MPIIRTENLSKTYRQDKIDINALVDINISINESDFVAITGPSGSGKSTLLHILGCIDRPSKGKMFINDEEISKMNPGSLTKLRLHEIGFVFQQFYLLPALNAFENVELPMKESGISGKQRKEKVMELLTAVGLGDRAKHRPGQLSGGEQQRVAIARALANNPGIILADEPTGELDSSNGKKILDLLLRINRKYGNTIIIVTHEKTIASRAKRIINIQDGRITSDVR